MCARDAGRDRPMRSRIENRKIRKTSEIEIGKTTNLKTGENFGRKMKGLKKGLRKLNAAEIIRRPIVSR